MEDNIRINKKIALYDKIIELKKKIKNDITDKVWNIMYEQEIKKIYEEIRFYKI